MNEFEFMLQMLLACAALVVSLVVGSLIGAMVVRVASNVLKLGEIPFLNALKATALATFVTLSLNFAAGFQQGLALANGRTPGYMVREVVMQFFSPGFMLMSLLSGLFITAIFLCLVVERKNNTTKLTLVEGLGLASLATAVAVAAAVLILGSIVALLIFVSRIT